MKAKHTPGPWIVANGNEVHDKIAGQDECGTRIGETPNMVTSVEYPYLDKDGQAANAQLIAAAPELLEACKLAFERLRPRGNVRADYPGHVAVAALGKAIARAEGEI